jgi:predicted ABC-type ATPase
MKKRMRVFAGPNGSGKSSIIKSIMETEVPGGKKLDFGIYVNADDIALDLQRPKGFVFDDYEIDFSEAEFLKIVRDSGLLNDSFSEEYFQKSILIRKDRLQVIPGFKGNKNDVERIAQIMADYLRKKLLTMDKKFSFETVFSHPGKVEIMKLARELGYKVYLYFVSTEHPDINIYRVKKVRVPANGHDVPEEKIVSRYYRSMEQLYVAAQYCYQCYFFDNSTEGGKQTLFAHFKVNANGDKEWDNLEQDSIPLWFKKYYSARVNP